MAWDPPTTNADGTAINNLAGYKILVGNAPGIYQRAVDVRDPTASGFIVDNLGPGTWYFTVRAYNTAGEESPNSNEASKVIQ